MDIGSHERCSISTSSMPNRKFIPSQLYKKGFELKSTDYEDSTNGWTTVPCWASYPCNDCGRLPRHNKSLIVAVHGVSRYDGTTQAQSAVGVYFAADSKWNTTVFMRAHTMTSQKAELQACLAALNTIYEIKGTAMKPLESVIIKTGSQSLFQSMTEHIFKWKANGYQNSQRLPLTNGALFQEVEEMIMKLKRRGVDILFWHVMQSCNLEANVMYGPMLSAYAKGVEEKNRAEKERGSIS